jgi:hypothetical protein
LTESQKWKHNPAESLNMDAIAPGRFIDFILALLHAPVLRSALQILTADPPFTP